VKSGPRIAAPLARFRQRLRRLPPGRISRRTAAADCAVAGRVRRIWIPSAGHRTVSETTSLSLPDGRAGLERHAFLHAIGQEKRPVLLVPAFGFVSPFGFVWWDKIPLLSSDCCHNWVRFVGLDFARLQLALMRRTPGPRLALWPACMWGSPSGLPPRFRAERRLKRRRQAEGLAPPTAYGRAARRRFGLSRTAHTSDPRSRCDPPAISSEIAGGRR
jgi:hypothetical protein